MARRLYPVITNSRIDMDGNARLHLFMTADEVRVLDDLRAHRDAKRRVESFPVHADPLLSLEKQLNP